MSDPESGTTTSICTMPGGRAGRYEYLFAVVDSGDSVVESKEDNNISYVVVERKKKK